MSDAIIKATDVNGVLDLKITQNDLVNIAVADAEEKLLKVKDRLQKEMTVLQKQITTADEKVKKQLQETIMKQWKTKLKALDKLILQFEPERTINQHSINITLTSDKHCRYTITNLPFSFSHRDYEYNDAILSMQKELKTLSDKLYKIHEEYAVTMDKLNNVDRYARAANAKLVKELIAKSGVTVPLLEV